MTDTETLMRQLADGRAGLAAFELRKQLAMSKPAEDRNALEAMTVDYFSKTFCENLTESQGHHRDRISPEDLGRCLGLYKKALKGLPLQTSTPYEKTDKGFRQMLRYSRSDVRAFLISLNPAYADYDFEPLLSTKEATEVFTQCEIDVKPHTLAALRDGNAGPEYIKLRPRVYRYRLFDVLDWIANPTEQTFGLAATIRGDV